MKIDLNCDLGESFGAYSFGADEEIVKYISSANIACGFHAADPSVMERTVKLCKQHGVSVGAHPGFNDLAGFGRRDMAVTPEDLKALVLYQIGALNAFCRAQDIKLKHVKPHGALYNMAAKDANLAGAVCQAVKEFDAGLILLAPFNSQMAVKAKQFGLTVRVEAFSDRGYNDDGSLVKRGEKNSMITDANQAALRVVRMVKDGKVFAVSGKDIEIKADSFCVHGDGANAVELAKKIAEKLRGNGIEIASF